MQHVRKIAAFIILVATPTLAVTADRAQSLLASGDYRLYDSPYAWDDAYHAQIRTLIAHRRYAEALRLVHVMDQQNGSESDNIDFVPDLAMVAAAAGNAAESKAFATLALEIQSAASHHAMCRETGDSYRLEFPQPLHLTMEEEVTDRTCNAFQTDRPVTTYPDFQAKLKWLR